MRRAPFSKFTLSVPALGQTPKFDVTEVKNLRPFLPRGAPKVLSAEDLADAAGKALLEAVKKKDPLLLCGATAMTGRVCVVFSGGGDYLEEAADPPYSEWVKAAAKTFLDNDQAVQDIAPAVAEAVDSTQLESAVTQLEHVEQAIQVLTPILESYQRLGKHLRNDIYVALTLVDRLARQGILNSLTLSQNLELFLRLFTQGSEDAQAQRKNNEQVADAARDATIEDVKEALAKAKRQGGPGQPPQGEPPAVDLDALKSNRNRSRGRNRTTS